MPYDRSTLNALLRRHGIAPTHQRLEIARVLFTRCQHLSAEQILQQVNERHAETSKATVYNTLNLFAEKGVIRQLAAEGDSAWFDSNTEPHFHFQDIDTGALTDLMPQEVSFDRLPPPPPGTEYAGIELFIRLRRV